MHFKFYNIPLNTDCNFDKLFLSNHSLTSSCICLYKCCLEVCSHRVNRAINNTYFAKSKTGQNHFKRIPEGLDLSWGCPGGGDGNN